MQAALKQVSVILVGFDVSDSDSLKECDEWIGFILKGRSRYTTVIAVGNVVDGVERKMTVEEATKRFEEKGALYMEIPESDEGYTMLSTVYSLVKSKRAKE